MAEQKKEPTKGLRVEVVEDPACRDHGAIAYIQTRLTQYAQDPFQTTHAEWSQAGVDATYINWLIETDERRREAVAKRSSSPGDLLVDMGDLTRCTIEKIPLDETYESMCEDFIQQFNHVVLQGIHPMTALYAFSQAFAITLGYALRANLQWPVAQAIIKQIMDSAAASEKMVRQVTIVS